MAGASMDAALRQIQRVFSEGTISGLSDSHLLEKFLDRRDEAAFTALVERHGTTVLETCRAVLRDADAAEDAFQATFLILVRKARSIRHRDALGGWLHRVAYRIAIQAGEDSARKSARERPVGDLHVDDRSRNDPSNDWREILHEEVARLSEKHRLPRTQATSARYWLVIGGTGAGKAVDENAVVNEDRPDFSRGSVPRFDVYWLTALNSVSAWGGVTDEHQRNNMPRLPIDLAREIKNVAQRVQPLPVEANTPIASSTVFE